MVDYFKKKIEQLLDTLLDPLWKRILALSWMGRLLVLVSALLAVTLATHPDIFVSTYRLGSCWTRVALNDATKIPIRAPLHSTIQQTAERIADGLEGSLHDPEKNGGTPWVVAQATIASHRISSLDATRIQSFLRAYRDPSCSCWREIPDDKHPRSIFVSGWIFQALAEVGVPASEPEIRFLLPEQQPDGWWSVFPVEGQVQYASAYGTAWALAGLNSQLLKGFVPANDAADVKLAVSSGSSWLLNHRLSEKLRWKDYPELSTGRTSESISGLVLHVLHQTSPQSLVELDKEWLDTLPTNAITASDSERDYYLIASKDGSYADDYVQIELPWLLIATVDAYPNGSLMQRAKALEWMEGMLNQESVKQADTQPDNWWRAELLYALSYVLQNT